MNQHRQRNQRGFTLIEVLVALLITAVGLLGLLKIQALAISSTREAGSRGLLASQVESLTAAMQANPLYWSMMTPPGASAPLGPPAPKIVISGASTISVGALATGADCKSTNCQPTQIAANDLLTWAASMYAQFPTYNATIICTQALPVNCGIYVTWTEHQVGINASTVNTTGTNSPAQSFSVYVQP